MLRINGQWAQLMQVTQMERCRERYMNFTCGVCSSVLAQLNIDEFAKC